MASSSTSPKKKQSLGPNARRRLIHGRLFDDQEADFLRACRKKGLLPTQGVAVAVLQWTYSVLNESENP